MLTYAIAGSGAALVAERMVVLIDMPLEEAAGLWDLVATPGVRIETVLTELMRQGVSHLRDFAIAELVDPALGVVTVAVRGEGKAQFGDTLIEGDGVSTWIEHTEELVMSVRLTLEDTGKEPLMLPIDRGMVKSSLLIWGSEAPSHLSETVSVRGTQTIPEPALYRDVAGQPVSNGTAASPAAVDRRPVNDPVDEHTVVRRALPKWMLRFTSGKVIGIGERVVVGRRPSPTISAGEQLETLLSPQREVSANHALLIGDEEGVRIIDLRSTNGTVVHVADGETFIVKDGNAALLGEGDRVDFGDGNEAECVRASHPSL